MSMQKTGLFITSALAIASAGAAAADSPPPVPAEPKAQCSVDALQKIAPQGTRILSVDQLKVPAPFCKIVGRSEEHTSELQSLMRISYAVFCLKKKSKT